MNNLTNIGLGTVASFVTLTATNVSVIDPALKDALLAILAILISAGTQFLSNWIKKKLN
jgi:hypothetical protein